MAAVHQWHGASSPRSKQAVPFSREIIDDLRRPLGRRVALEFRMDATFFQRGILHLLTARDCAYAIKVGYSGVTGHETELVVSQWNDLRLRVVLYPKHVAHETRRNFQLDLFTPDDGNNEYSAVAGRHGRAQPDHSPRHGTKVH